MNSAAIPPLPLQQSDRLVSLAFFLLVLFTTIGIERPFVPQVLGDDELQSVRISSAANQLFLMMVYMLVLPAAYRLRHWLIELALREKALTIFLAWCGISVLFGELPIVSAKRWIQLLGSVLVCACFVHDHRTCLGQLRAFRLISMFALPISLVSVFVLPAAIDIATNPPGWRGMADSKNTLGQLAAFGAIAWLLAARHGPAIRRMFSYGMILICLVLLAGSRSTTSQMALLLVAGLAVIDGARARFSTIGVGTVFIFLTATTFLLATVTIVILWPTFFADLLGSVGKDPTFTGRTPLWLKVLEEANSHPLTGFGYAGFWIPINPKAVAIVMSLGWIPPHAHQGYLDILNDTGYPGLLMLLVLVFAYLRGVFQGRGDHSWLWFIAFILILNFQESQLFRVNTFSTVLFVVAYLTSYLPVEDGAGGQPGSTQVPEAASRPPTRV